MPIYFDNIPVIRFLFLRDMQELNKTIQMLTSQLLCSGWNHFLSNWRALGDHPVRNYVFISPLFSLPLPTLFQFLIGFLDRSNRLGEMSLWLMWLWRMTSTNAGRLKHFATSSLLHGVLTSRGSFPAPDWSSTKAVTSPWSKHCFSLTKTFSQLAESAVFC